MMENWISKHAKHLTIFQFMFIIEVCRISLQTRNSCIRISRLCKLVPAELAMLLFTIGNDAAAMSITFSRSMATYSNILKHITQGCKTNYITYWQQSNHSSLQYLPPNTTRYHQDHQAPFCRGHQVLAGRCCHFTASTMAHLHGILQSQIRARYTVARWEHHSCPLL